MNLARDTQTLADFTQKASEFARQLKETGEPIVLTIDDNDSLVVQDAASYRKLLAKVEEAEVLEGIRRGLEDYEAGRVIPLEQFKEETRAKYGIRV